MPQQLLDQLPVLVPILVAFLAYMLGRRQTIHERLYTRRAEVIAALFERFEELDQKVSSLVRPFEPGGEPDKKEKAKLAGQSFNDLQRYYRSNSIWLSRGTNRLFSDFLNRYKRTINDFVFKVVTNEDRADAITNQWDEVWRRFESESPEIREALELDFRAALGERRARISLALKSARDAAKKLGSGPTAPRELNRPEDPPGRR